LALIYVIEQKGKIFHERPIFKQSRKRRKKQVLFPNE
jgi:hypothetical protein